MDRRRPRRGGDTGVSRPIAVAAMGVPILLHVGRARTTESRVGGGGMPADGSLHLLLERHPEAESRLSGGYAAVVVGTISGAWRRGGGRVCRGAGRVAARTRAVDENLAQVGVCGSGRDACA